MNWQTFKRPVIGLAAAVLFGASAHADRLPSTLAFDVSGISSNDAVGSAINEKRSLFVGSQAILTGLSFSGELFADNPSWLSEMAIRFSSSTGDFFDFAPSFSNAGGAEMVSVDVADLSAALGSDFQLGMDGLLGLEFHELDDTFSNDFDGTWNFGTLLVNASVIPNPASLALAGLALAGMCAASRRRRPAAR